MFFLLMKPCLFHPACLLDRKEYLRPAVLKVSFFPSTSVLTYVVHISKYRKWFTFSKYQK